MSCVYLVDSRNGGRGIDQPVPDSDSEIRAGVVVGNCSTDLQRETATLDLDSPLNTSDTVVVWLSANGEDGASSIKITATADFTRANIISQQLLKNRDDNYDS